jgi:hypothetical protein
LTGQSTVYLHGLATSGRPAGAGVLPPRRAPRAGLVDGAPAILVTPAGRFTVVMVFTITDGTILAIEFISNPRRLSRLTIEPR